MLFAGSSQLIFFFISIVSPLYRSLGLPVMEPSCRSPCLFLSALAVQVPFWHGPERPQQHSFSISLADSGLLAIFNFPLDPQKLFSCSLSGNSLICCDAYEMVSEGFLPRVGQHFMHKRNTERSRWLHQGLMILTQYSV